MVQKVLKFEGKNSKGLALLELLFGILIIILIAFYLSPKIFKKETPLLQKSPEIKKTKEVLNYTEIVNLKKAILNFQSFEGRLPSSLNELLEKGYIKNIPKDEFGNEISYIISADGTNFSLVSPGEDKILGTGDDIRY